MGDGDVVQRAPNRLLSGSRRKRRLTQDQLAQAVREAYWRLFGKEAPIDAEHISKLERGIITWPNARYRAAFREVLGATADAELGFYYRHPRDTVKTGADARQEVDPTRRDEFIHLVTGLSTGAYLGISGLGTTLPDPVREVLALAVEPNDPPVRVGRTDVEQVRFATELFRSWRGCFGGGVCRKPLLAQLRWAAGLLRGQAQDAIRPELYSAVGSLAQVAGWGDVDAGRHDTALICFQLGLHCAEKAQDWTLRAQVLTDTSRQAVDRGQVDDATSLIELAQVRADRVAGSGRAMMSSMHARILGAAGRVTDCRRAVAAAEDHIADHRPADECCGSSLFQRATVAEIALYNGHALFDASLRHPTTAPVATDQLRAALGSPSSISRRRRAVGTTKLRRQRGCEWTLGPIVATFTLSLVVTGGCCGSRDPRFAGWAESASGRGSSRAHGDRDRSRAGDRSYRAGECANRVGTAHRRRARASGETTQAACARAGHRRRHRQ
ncbi:MAG: hypothetical protein ACRDTG_03930 [Pseudonocardiaceae bacterium]